MTKTTKTVLKSIGAIIIVLVLVIIGFGLKMYYEIHGMTPAGTVKINDTVYCVGDKFADAFLFKGANGWMMIDAGIGDDSFRDELSKLGLKPEDVTTVLLTHTDSDHVGALGLFKHPRILLHRDEEQMIDGRNGKFFFSKTKWKYGPYELFDSNDTLHIEGLSVRVIHTPGHTPGSCCFLVNGAYLATGDNASYKDGKFSTFNDFFNMNTEEQKTAMAKVPELNSTPYVLTAHYGIIKNK